MSLGAQYHVGAGEGRPDLQVNPEILPIFPLFYSYYDKNPAGRLLIGNEESSSLENVTVSFFVKQYMDQPKLCGRLPCWRAASEKEVPVFALFNAHLLRDRGRPRPPARSPSSYSYLGTASDQQLPGHRDREEPQRHDLGRRPQGRGLRHRQGPARPELRQAHSRRGRQRGRASFNGRLPHGHGPVPGARATTGSATSRTRPRRTRSSRRQAGGRLPAVPRPDPGLQGGRLRRPLRILYCALLESVGMPTAFVTAPGHIYVAFDLGLDPEAARKIFNRPDDLIFRDGGTWLPVEITLVQGRLPQGLAERGEGVARRQRRGQGRLLPGAGSLEALRARGLRRRYAGFLLPDPERILKTRRELARFLGEEVQARPRRWRSSCGEPRRDKALNRLGVLYARYGLLDEAAASSTGAAKPRGDPPRWSTWATSTTSGTTCARR